MKLFIIFDFVSYPLTPITYLYLLTPFLRPIPAGVTIMALGAMAAHPDLDVKIVPCGLNYFHPHRFRSRAVIEFGSPISIPPEYVTKFKAGGTEKREACGKLLDSIYNALKSVTVGASDYETLMVRVGWDWWV